MPSWLSSERDFWVAYADGVSESVLRYLEASGYPQHEKEWVSIQLQFERSIDNRNPGG